ncbi:hypothetical protein [Szabonella alba]|uniref:Uncharacterized protein n=1 Tax=Szabonella alba TaxID=2804194 RepID=A0A8K0Y0Y3_9RHOB|nr:hypothetical protein [Szabonella alba]MBL4917598.1 hypothetical protein [Szabonella alba]
MPVPEVDNRISFGNVIVIATILFSGGIAWATMGVTGRQNAEDLRKSIGVSEQHEARIHALEMREAAQIARIETQLLQINRTLDGLARRLEGGRG